MAGCSPGSGPVGVAEFGVSGFVGAGAGSEPFTGEFCVVPVTIGEFVGAVAGAASTTVGAVTGTGTGGVSPGVSAGGATVVGTTIVISPFGTTVSSGASSGTTGVSGGGILTIFSTVVISPPLTLTVLVRLSNSNGIERDIPLFFSAIATCSIFKRSSAQSLSI